MIDSASRMLGLGLSTHAEQPQNSRTLFRLQQASPELPLRPLDDLLAFFYGYIILLTPNHCLFSKYFIQTAHTPCGCSVTIDSFPDARTVQSYRHLTIKERTDDE